MSAAYRRLLARQPPPGPAPATLLASDARSLREWRDALPLANAASAARRLLEGVQSLNAQRLPPQRRLDAMELLRAVLLPLADALDRQIIGAGFPLPPQQAALGELAGALQAGFAAGYRAALLEFLAPRGTLPFLRGGAVALAAVRALQHGAASLASACVLYRAPPRGAWQDLHDLHALATHVRLESRTIIDAAARGESCARETYLQALLFALANPYAFSQREQQQVATVARALAAHARLSGRAAEGVTVPVEADRGPGYVDHERDLGAGGGVALDLEALLQFAGERLARAEGARAVVLHAAGGTPLEIDAGLLRRVLESFVVRGDRGHARIGGNHAMDTVLGLRDLHTALAGAGFDDFEQRLGGGIDTGAGAPWRGAELREVVPRSARVLDQALGGYRLLWQGAASGEGVRARIGEAIGLSLPARDGAPDWMVGVIRWLRIDEGGDIECGVQLLSRRALPALVRTPGDAMRGALRGIALASLDAAPGDDYASLLVSTELDRDAASIEVNLPLDTAGAPCPPRRIDLESPVLVAGGGVYALLQMPGSPRGGELMA